MANLRDVEAGAYVSDKPVKQADLENPKSNRGVRFVRVYTGRIPFATIVRYMGLVASCLTLLLGCIHVFAKGARVEWPGSFIEDVNYYLWRRRLFSLTPEVLIDNMTPAALGFVGIHFHFETTFNVIGSSFIRYAFFNFFVALYGNLGYRGGLGILVACFTLITTAACMAVGFACKESASLQLPLMYVEELPTKSTSGPELKPTAYNSECDSQFRRTAIPVEKLPSSPADDAGTYSSEDMTSCNY